jgi:hypothetical protein
MTGAALGARRAAVCLVLAAVACTDRAAPSSAPAPAQDGAAMLRAAIAAEQSIVYTGYKRTICGEEGEGRATRMKVSRTAAGRTFLTWDPGGGDSRHWVYESRAGWRSDPELLLRNYEVVVDPSDGPAVAWRDTRRLTLRGRRPGRPSLELLVDKERSIVLREEFRDF